MMCAAAMHRLQELKMWHMLLLDLDGTSTKRMKKGHKVFQKHIETAIFIQFVVTTYGKKISLIHWG